MNAPLVSVVIPTWNRAELLGKAVASVLAQSYRNLEVLVCDDGSSDNSRQVIEQFGDSRIQWVAGNRGGRPAIPRNHGLRLARGDWIAFLDSDDEWLSHKIERQLDSVRNTGCLASCCNAVRLSPEKGVLGSMIQFQHPTLTFSDLLKVNQVVCSSAMIHRSLLKHVRGFPEASTLRAIEDYALWLRVTTLTDFAYLAEELVNYRDDAVNSVRADGPSHEKQRQRVFGNFMAWSLRRPAQAGISATLAASKIFFKSFLQRN